jgi:hypothetical protein
MNGRTIVYLDQNHWIYVGQAKHGDARLSQPDRDAALWLIDRVHDGSVILPLSATHVSETGYANAGPSRKRLAKLMIELSNGWQIQNVLDVRARELGSVFGLGPRVNSDDIFGRSAGLLFGDDPIADRTDPVQTFIGTIEWRDDLSNVLANGVANEWERRLAKTAANIWASENNRMAQELSTLRNLPMAERRAETLRLFLVDIWHDIERVCSNLEIEIDWTKDRVDQCELDLSRMPYLGRAREVTHSRLSNPQHTWVANDLFDLHQLSCAAGYADVVVAEREFCGHLRTADRRLQRSGMDHANRSAVVATLPAAVEVVRALVDRTMDC